MIGAEVPMPVSHISKFKPVELLHHTCAWCEGPMYLTQIGATMNDYDVRTYECAECGNSRTETVKHGPPTAFAPRP